MRLDTIEKQNLLWNLAFEYNRRHQEKHNGYFPQVDVVAGYLNHMIKDDSEEKKISWDNLEELAKYFGCFVFSFNPEELCENAESPEKISDIINRLRALNYKKLIPLSMNQTKEEAKFSFAHELGHIILEHNGPSYVDALNTSSLMTIVEFLKNELEANYFAGALLLEEKRLREDLKTTGYNMDQIVDEYEITYETAVHRTMNVSEIDLHFMKTEILNVNGEDMLFVRKYFSTDGVYLPWSRRRSICERWGASRCLQENRDEWHQFSVYPCGARYFCVSKLVKKRNKEYSITFGCKAEEAYNLSAYSPNESEAFRISSEHPCEHKYCGGN
jgi:predicted transcriptional regulator